MARRQQFDACKGKFVLAAQGACPSDGDYIHAEP
jgi:hypothetical protein